jgi:hypothetical protein
MMALTIRQPWAWAIAAAGKDVENRSWHTGYRGPLAIHAGLAEAEPDGMPADACRGYAWALIERDARGRAGRTPAAALGAIIAVAELAGCHLHDAGGEGCGHDGRWRTADDDLCSQWAQPGQWHWQVAHVRPLAQPLPLRGRIGLWPVPAAQRRLLLAEIGGQS